MARKPVQIEVVSDTRAFGKGIKSGVIEPLDDVEKSLEDVSRAGDRAGDDLVDDLEKAQRSTEDLADEHKELAKTIERESRSSNRKFADEAEKGTSRASQGIDEFKAEATANFSEVASSFTGDVGGAIDLVQGTLGGLAGSIPGVGIALGALGAVAGVMASKWQKNTELAKQRVQDMYEDMLESGDTFISASLVQDELKKIWGEAEDTAVSLNALKLLSDATGLSQAEWANAYAGDADARASIIGKLTRKEEELQHAYEGATEADIIHLDAVEAGYAEAWDAIAKIEGETANAKGKVESYRDSVTLLKNDYEKAADAARTGYGHAVDAAAAFNDEIRDIPASKTTTVTVKANVDTKALYAGVQGAFDKKRFKVFVDAYTAPNRNGAPRP